MKSYKQWLQEVTLTYYNPDGTRTKVEVKDEPMTKKKLYTPNDMISYVREIHPRDEDFEEGDLEDRISNYPKYKLMDIKIDDIDVEFSYDEGFVEDLADEIKAGKEINPIIVYKDSGYYEILDGTHRTEAAKLAGLTTIKAYVGGNWK